MSETPEKDDKTEDPTQRRLDQAIERGDVAKSQEVISLFLLSGLALALLILAAPVTRGLALDLRAFLMNAHQVPADGAGFLEATRRAVLAGPWAAALPIGLVALAVLAGAGMQHRLLWTTEPLMPKFECLSPMAGFACIFGMAALV